LLLTQSFPLIAFHQALLHKKNPKEVFEFRKGEFFKLGFLKITPSSLFGSITSYLPAAPVFFLDPRLAAFPKFILKPAQVCQPLCNDDWFPITKKQSITTKILCSRKWFRYLPSKGLQNASNK